ncbi:MAG: hypothetical protein ACYCZY_12720, partial [Lacisediminihabitans sp.]
MQATSVQAASVLPVVVSAPAVAGELTTNRSTEPVSAQGAGSSGNGSRAHRAIDRALTEHTSAEVH